MSSCAGFQISFLRKCLYNYNYNFHNNFIKVTPEGSHVGGQTFLQMSYVEKFWVQNQDRGKWKRHGCLDFSMT